MSKILVIEDDQALSQLICKRLSTYGFEAIEIESFYHTMQQFTETMPDLVLLDINLPYEDGYILCKKMRARSNVPILMISARSEEVEQIMAIEIGADDYIVKPFTMDILIVKIQALLRRAKNTFSTAEGHYQYNQLLLNFHTMSLHYLDQQYALSKNEALLFKTFFTFNEQFIEKNKLIENVWGLNTIIEENTLITNIRKARQLLAMIHPSFQIETKRNFGYRLIQKGD